jgi:hypothetical protein
VPHYQNFQIIRRQSTGILLYFIYGHRVCMYHKPALNCRCSSQTYAPFQTTTVRKLLKEYKLWHHEEIFRELQS